MCTYIHVERLCMYVGVRVCVWALPCELRVDVQVCGPWQAEHP